MNTDQTQIKERPILFQAEMVHALLEGRKTQTRRIVKYPEFFGCLTGDCPHENQKECNEAIAEWSKEECPYGKPGERLWVRETWQEVHPCQISEGRFTTAGRARIPGSPNINYEVIYRADGEYPKLHFSDKYPFRRPCIGATCKKPHVHPEENYNGWAASIFMPRWASRILLEITEVRVERLQEISENDSEKEGIQFMRDIPDADETLTAEQLYEILWDSINGAGGRGANRWVKNPWVWVISFKKI